MPLRRLCNIAYADLAEIWGRDSMGLPNPDGLRDLDTLLDEGPDVLRERRSRDQQRRLLQTMGLGGTPA